MDPAKIVSFANQAGRIPGPQNELSSAGKHGTVEIVEEVNDHNLQFVCQLGQGFPGGLASSSQPDCRQIVPQSKQEPTVWVKV
jgi:hypothetical protein